MQDGPLKMGSTAFCEAVPPPRMLLCNIQLLTIDESNLEMGPWLCPAMLLDMVCH